MLKVDLRVNAVHFGHVPGINIDHYHSYPTELEAVQRGKARLGLFLRSRDQLQAEAEPITHTGFE